MKGKDVLVKTKLEPMPKFLPKNSSNIELKHQTLMRPSQQCINALLNYSKSIEVKRPLGKEVLLHLN